MTDGVAGGKPRVTGLDEDLDLLFAAVAALRGLAADDRADRGRVYDFAITWGTLLAGRLRRVDHYHRRGDLTPGERARYAALRAALREALPLMERLDIARPAVPLD